VCTSPSGAPWLPYQIVTERQKWHLQLWVTPHNSGNRFPWILVTHGGRVLLQGRSFKRVCTVLLSHRTDAIGSLLHRLASGGAVCPYWQRDHILHLVGVTPGELALACQPEITSKVAKVAGIGGTSSFLSRAPVMAFRTRKMGLKPSPIALPFVRIDVCRTNFLTPAFFAASISLMTPCTNEWRL